MKTKFFFFSFFVFFLFIFISNAVVYAELSTKITSYVNDNADIFSTDQKAALEQNLRDFEKQTNSVQIVVFTENEIPSDTTLEERSLAIAEQNGIGKKGADNGILFYIAIADKKYRWEVGYGAESTLNTPLLGRVSRTYMVPYFQDGDYAQGIIVGIDVVQKVLLNSTDADIMALQEEGKDYSVWVGPVILGCIIIFIIVFFIAISSATKKFNERMKEFDKKDVKPGEEDAAYAAVITSLFFDKNSRSSNWSSGSGSSWGGFHGGGGSFGGGGFSGGW